MKFSFIAIGESKPDFVSNRIQYYMSLLHKRVIDWSHAALLVEDAGKDSGVWDLTGRGFDHCSLKEALEGSVMRRKVYLNVKDPHEAIGWLKGYRGTEYSNLQYCLFIFPERFRRVLSWIMPGFLRKIFRNGKGMGVCSEGVARFIFDNCPTATGDKRLSDRACDEIDPYEVYLISLDYGTEAPTHGW